MCGFTYPLICIPFVVWEFGVVPRELVPNN